MELPHSCPKCGYGSQLEHCTSDDVWDGPRYTRSDPQTTLGEIRGEHGPGVSAEWLAYSCRICRYSLKQPCRDAR